MRNYLNAFIDHGAINSEGYEKIDTREYSYRGSIRINFPINILTIENIEDIVKNVVIENIYINSISL
jgi:hypothetical protein